MPCHDPTLRLVDEKKEDAFLHRTSGDKGRLKTNLDVHIEHVKGGVVVPAIRLMKLWRVRRGLSIEHFGLELLTIETLRTKKSSNLDTQLRHAWRTLRDDDFVRRCVLILRDRTMANTGGFMASHLKRAALLESRLDGLNDAELLQ